MVKWMRGTFDFDQPYRKNRSQNASNMKDFKQ